MQATGDQKWCHTGNCPCPVREYIKQRMDCFLFEEIAEEVRENEIKIMNCLINLLERDVVCRDKTRWCPDNPY